MRILKYLILIAFLSSCTTSQQSQDSTENANDFKGMVSQHLAKRAGKITSLEFSGAIISKREGSSQRGNFELAMYQTDSLLLSIYMPLGNVLVGALSANPEEFLYYDAFRSEAIEGESSAENLERILYLPLSHADVAHIIRGEIPGGIAGFEEFTSDEGLTSLVRKRDGIVERVLYSRENHAISQYARKDETGKTLVTVNYGDFEPVDGTPFASVVKLDFPKAEMGLTLRCDQIIINQPASNYNFALPDGIKRRRY